MTRSAIITIRVSKDTKQRIQAAADADHRAMSDWLMLLAERELERLARPDVKHEREMLKYR